MAKFGRGSAGITSAAKQGGSNKFMPNIRWAKDETKYIQFLHPIEDALSVFFHSFIVVGYRDNGKPIYRNFVSPQTDADNEGNITRNRDAYDPLWDDHDLPARKRTFAFGVELEPVWGKNGKGKKVIDSFEVATREWTDKEGETHEVPAVGLIEGSPSAFFSALDTFADSKGPIEAFVFQITRKGTGKDTKYVPFDITPALEDDELGIPDELIVDLEEYLESLVMTDDDIEMLSKLPEDHVFNEYAERNKKDKAKSNDKAKSSDSKPAAKKSAAARKASSKVEEPEDDESGAEDDGEEDDSKENRFAQLRRNMANR
jgi:hypothetical protein